MQGRIDVHSHLLPGIDDGCKTALESIECARMLVSAGYSKSFCTPHVWPNYPHINRNTIPVLTQQLQNILNQEGIPLQLHPGGELNLHAKVMEMTEDEIIPMAVADRYILADMWADKIPDWFDSTIKWLQDKGLTVILAHPERMRAVQDNPSLSKRFADLGILLQGNLQCFADPPSSHTRRTAELYLSENRYFLLGSDTHEPKGLKQRLLGLQNAIALAGDAVINRLTRENPAKLLPG